MCDIVHTIDGRRKCQNRCRIAVYTQILRQLVIGSLDKCAVYAVDRFATAFRNTGGECHSCFLGDSDIHELSARFFSLIFREAHYRRCGRCDGHNTWIFFHFFHQVVTGNAGIILTTKICDYLAGLDIERQMPVPLFLECFGELVAFSFQGTNVYHNWFYAVLDALKRLD